MCKCATPYKIDTHMRGLLLFLTLLTKTLMCVTKTHSQCSLLNRDCKVPGRSIVLVDAVKESSLKKELSQLHARLSGEGYHR